MPDFLVTGGAGFIGSHLVTALVRRGDRARVLDDCSTGRRSNLSHLELGEPGSGAPVEWYEGDVVDAELLERACSGAAGILHEAAQVSVPRSFEDPVRSYEVNALGTLRLLEAARRARVPRLILAASSAAYGDSPGFPKTEAMTPRPLSPYAAGKLAAEELCAVWSRRYALTTACLRYFNVYGPRQADDSPYSGVIAIFARSLLRGRPVTIFGDGEQTRDFVYVEDVVRANLAALEAELEPGELINVGTGEEVSLNTLYGEMCAVAGSRASPRYGAERPGDPRRSVASIERARQRLGWTPTVGRREGLAATLEWYRPGATVG